MNKIITEKESYTHENSRYRFYSVRRGNHQSLLGAVRALDDSIAGADIIKCEIPTEFEASIDALKAAIDAHQPNAILCVGQFGGSPSIQIERVAINLRDARTPDNAGFQPHDQPVVDSAPDAFFATIPTRQITERLRAAGIPAALSYSAGTYVCNNLLYAALYENSQAGKGNSARCGFIHVPYLPIRLLPPFPMLPV